MKTTILLLLISTLSIGQSYNWDSIAIETQKKLDRNESIVDSISRMEVMNAIKKKIIIKNNNMTEIKIKKENLQGAVSGWVAVTDALPKPLQTVWLTNGKGWVCLGCLVEDAEGWHWAESNGVIYIENGEIVSECESEDLDVNFWHELPKPPCH